MASQSGDELIDCFFNLKEPSKPFVIPKGYSVAPKKKPYKVIQTMEREISGREYSVAHIKNVERDLSRVSKSQRFFAIRLTFYYVSELLETLALCLEKY